MKWFNTLFALMLTVSSVFLTTGEVLGSTEKTKQTSSQSLTNEGKFNDLEYNIQMRKKWGLRSDKDFVKNQILAKKGESDVTREFGFYLTETEAKQLKERFNFLNENVPKIKEFVKEQVGQKEFGGLFVRQDEGGTLYIGLKNLNNKPASLMDKIKDSYGNDNIQFFNAKYSIQELNQVHSKLYEDISKLKKQNIKILSISTDVIENQVNVGIEAPTSEKVKKLKDLYGPMLNIYKTDEDKHDEVAKTDVIRPIQGGAQVQNDDSGALCSAGFSAWEYVSSGEYNYYVITAGHCYSGGGTDYFSQPNSGDPDVWYIGGTNALDGMVKNSGDVDALLITALEDYTSYYVYYTSFQQYDLTDYQQESDEYVGQSVCMSGYNEEGCGEIVSTNVSANYNTNLTAADYPNDYGSSGGTVFYNDLLMGVNEGLTDVDGQQVSTYTQVENVMDEFNVYPVLN